MQITFLYAKVGGEWPNELYLSALKELSDSEQVRNLKYRRWQDRQANILGKLLLKQGLILLSLNNSLKDIAYTEYKKPYFKNGPYFNVSHSGNYVVCVLANIEVGVDIEQISESDFNLFHNVFTSKEWEFINAAKGAIKNNFYKLWTRKESIIKANGKGMYINLRDFEVLEKECNLFNESYLCFEIEISTEYACHITIKRAEAPLIQKIYVDTDQLIRQQF